MMPGGSGNLLMPGSLGLPANAGSYLDMEMPMSQPMAGPTSSAGEQKLLEA